MNPEKKFPIAETFDSVQGEGLYVGTRMLFIRFAGCSVGRKLSESQRVVWAEKNPEFAKNNPFSDKQIDGLQLYTEECQGIATGSFLCDTNFTTREAMTVSQILELIPEGVKHICFTGGEPLDQPLAPLLAKIADDTNLGVHIETSGTVDIRDRAYPDYHPSESLSYYDGWLWLTVSPKRGVLPEMLMLADEIKLLVDETFDLDKVPAEVFEHPLVFLQPINKEWGVDTENLKRCLAIQKNFPDWRISCQSHKLWSVR